MNADSLASAGFALDSWRTTEVLVVLAQKWFERYRSRQGYEARPKTSECFTFHKVFSLLVV